MMGDGRLGKVFVLTMLVFLFLGTLMIVLLSLLIAKLYQRVGELEERMETYRWQS